MSFYFAKPRPFRNLLPNMNGGLFTKQLLLISLMLFSVLGFAIAQTEPNPFDLQHRIPKNQKPLNSEEAAENNPFDIESRQVIDTPNIEPEAAKPPVVENPFDINRVKSSKTREEAKTKTITQTPPELEIIQKPKDTRNRLLFWPILIMMIILALLVTLYRSLIGKIYRAFSNENILKLLQREQGVFISIPYLFLYALFFVSAGIFVFQLAIYYNTIPFEFSNLMYCILAVTGFFLLKHLILKIIEIIFPIAKEIKQYSFTIIIFSIILGILLIPLNIFIAFTAESLTFTGIILAFLTIAAVYLFRSLRGIFIGSKFLAFHKFHFFMYLCAVEIAPVIILVKILMTGANVH